MNPHILQISRQVDQDVYIQAVLTETKKEYTWFISVGGEDKSVTFGGSAKNGMLALLQMRNLVVVLSDVIADVAYDVKNAVNIAMDDTNSIDPAMLN
jgi:hypothetical protein